MVARLLYPLCGMASSTLAVFTVVWQSKCLPSDSSCVTTKVRQAAPGVQPRYGVEGTHPTPLTPACQLQGRDIASPAWWHGQWWLNVGVLLTGLWLG
jgi:hypothetical protein